VFDYLLLGQYPSEEDMALTRESKSSAPIGKPRVAALMPLPGQVAAAASSAAASASAASSPASGVSR
jgi:penicillin-binding protein 2